MFRRALALAEDVRVFHGSTASVGVIGADR
jgi:hypothetical protein